MTPTYWPECAQPTTMTATVVLRALNEMFYADCYIITVPNRLLNVLKKSKLTRILSSRRQGLSRDCTYVPMKMLDYIRVRT